MSDLRIGTLPQTDDLPPVEPAGVVGRPSVLVPAWLVALAGLVAALGCGMTIAGAITGGISADEPTHVKRLTMYFENGLYVVKKEVAKTDADGIPNNAFVYAPVTTGLAHVINKAVGNEGAGEVARTGEAYEVRHLVVAGFGIAGLVAAGILGAILLGSWRWGVVSAAVLAAIPMWTGHAMFNPKDTPVGAGHTLATLGFVLIASGGPRGRAWRLVTGALVLSSGAIIMMGTRPGMWVSLTISLIAFLIVLAWIRAFRWPVLLAVGASVTAGYLALLAIYPRVFGNPLTMLWTSAWSSADFPHGKDNGRLYQLDQMFQVWPMLLLAFLVVGTVATIILIVRAMGARSSSAVVLMLVGSQAFALPIMIAARNSHLYNGLRQTLFAVPAQAVLATLGIATIMGLRTSIDQRVWRVGGACLAAVALILPTVVQMSLFPYQYSYENVEAEIGKNPVEPDYFETSFREFVPYVHSQVKLVCPHRLSKGKVYRTDPDCRTRRGRTFSAYWRFEGKGTWDLTTSNKFYALLRGSVGDPPYCHVIHEVSRWQNLERVTMSRLFLCQPPPTAKNTPKRKPVDPFDPDWAG